MNKKILILGAGVYQVPLIKKAKEMGLTTIVCSIPGDYPGFAFADKVYHVNTTDCEGVLQVAREEGIAGICTTGTDVAVITIGYVCEKLGLAGLPLESAKIATNKALMKQCFKENGVPTASFFVVESKEEALAAFDELKKPVVMKIVDKSGSRGIYRVDERSQVAGLFEKELSQTAMPYVVMEEFIEAHEIGVDALVQGGEVKVILPHDKIVHRVGNVTIPAGHVAPFVAADEVLDKLDKVATGAIRAMELDNCAVNMDVFVGDDGEINVIEVGGRCGATGIPEVLGRFGGFDYYEMIIKLALGEKIEVGEMARVPAASVLLHSEVTGVLKEIRVPEMNNCQVSFDYEKGHKVLKMEDGTDRIGQVILWDEELDVLKEKIERVLTKTVVEVE